MKRPPKRKTKRTLEDRAEWYASRPVWTRADDCGSLRVFLAWAYIAGARSERRRRGGKK